MSTDTVISPRVYRAIQNVDFDEIAKLSVTQKPLRPVLPFLVRMSLLAPVPDALTKQNNDIRKQILVILNNLDHVNSLVRHLTIEFHLLEQDVKKEQQLRQKLGSSKKDSILIQNVGDLTTEFERCDSTRRIRLILSELLFIQSQIAEQQSKSSTDFLIKQSDLFDNVVYLEELSDIISIAIAELPSLLNVTDVVETLLHVNNSARVICAIVANKPCCFMEVVTSLIANAERQEEDSVGSRTRMSVLVALCEMNPGQALAVRARCVELCRMPALTARLSQTREGQEGDMVSFLSGLLLGYDQTTRNWFAQFIRTSQKRKGEGATAVQLLRDELLRRLKDILSLSTDSQLPKSCVRQATSLLRLYCSLRGIAGIKFGDEELNLLLKLVTSRPPASPVGVRFVSLGLCMLIACPSLLSHPSHEAKGIEWVQWLVQEEAYFESASGVTASFGEMLLLMAIHFHSNQLSAICELVCATLGMKVPLRPNNMTRLKQIFTQEIFTEQVVASHAVKVPVTVNLNANIPGYLPVHCIHQLLKSRVFAKHKVSIKGWIYKQICNVSEPVHPVLPHLIEAYITSMLVPNLKAQSEHTHKPISEEEIRKVFQNSVFGAHFNKKRKVCSVFEFGEETQDVDDVVIGKPTLASQLLLLYYLLLYEDVRLSNTINNITNGREVKSYSTEFLSELPIKFLLLQAEKGQSLYACLFAPLLKLATTHFPHLSLVDDWFQDVFSNSSSYKSDKLTEDFIKEAFNTIETNPKKTIKMLKKLLHQRPIDIWVYANTFIRYIKDVLGDKTQRKVQELYKDIWMQLNTVLPRSLWVMTINSLQNENAATKDVSLTQENILVDPLQVLRCDKRVFRCAPILQIVLRMLHASLAASKIQLTRHMMDKPLIEKSGQLCTETEREELRIALVASQESLSVQILLDACVENDDDRNNPGQKTALCEIRSLICSHLHQVFIADPSLVKLIHFQGYSRELIGMTMRGIPSMHICLDFIPELLSQSCIEKQIFAVDLISELSLQYPLPKSMSVARLCVNALSTLLGALSSDTSVILFRSTLPCLVRICQVFPPLLEDIISLLMQLGRVAESQASLGRISAGPQTVLSPMSRIQAQQSRETQSDELCEEIQETMNDIFKKALLQSNIMSKTETTEHKDGILKRLPKEKKVLTFVRDLSDVNEEIKCDEIENEFDSEYSESESDEMSLDHDSLDVKYKLTDLFDDGVYCNVSNTDIVPEGLQEKKENDCQNKGHPMDID